MQKGIIFNIQKFSIHDGPGIRTTVFLKGCPLRCTWCSNPESQSRKPEVMMETIGNQLHYCSFKGNRIIGEYKPIDEIIKICLQDVPFYEESGGGVTFSGGEAMYQPEFLREIIKKLKPHNIHIAIETAGYVSSKIFKELASSVDLLIFDIKHYDSNIHFQQTFVYNELIIKNLKWAVDNNIKLLVRIPIIPNFNAAVEDAEGIARLLNRINVNEVQLLPFHQFGEKKYEMLNRPYLHNKIKALHQEDLNFYRDVFIKHNINCYF